GCRYLVCRYPAHRDLHPFPTRRSSDLGVVRVLEHLTDHVGDRRHLDLAHPPRRDGRRSKADATRLERRTRLEGDGVLVDSDPRGDRKSTRLNSSHVKISYAVFCLKKKN